MFRKKFIAFIIGLFFTQLSYAQLNLIPQPQEFNEGKETLVFSDINIETAFNFENEIKLFSDFLETTKGKKKEVVLHIEQGNVKNPFGFEGAYAIEISKQITIKAPTNAGVHHAFQTLKQLLANYKTNNGYALPYCSINDWPAFKVRGFMHDVGRNFISLDRLKEHIEIMSLYKYNIFHFHLTDNHGWRLESKKYPQLQDEAATNRNKGKYYTQQEFKDLVQFCKERHITIIPELDMPGHTEAFRKALKLSKMNSVKVQRILIDLVEELCTLASAHDMPYIHLGTDEVRGSKEKVDNSYMLPIIKTVEKNGRESISWWQGIKTKGDKNSIKQLWAQSEPLKGHAYIDSRANYINHLDPLCAPVRLFFQQPCRVPNGDKKRLGGILCSWPDNNVKTENDIFEQNPIYLSLVAYSESIWKGVDNGTEDQFWAQLPQVSTKEYADYLDFEKRLLFHRNQFFEGKEFQFVENAHIPWRFIGPFDHSGDLEKSFEVETNIQEEYQVEGKTYTWGKHDLHGGTVHLKHFFDFPSPIKEKEGTVYALNYMYSDKEQEVDFWIGFHGWSRAGGRRGGPTPKQGQWHNTNPKIWVNDREVQPPNWQQPYLATETEEVPFMDEDYFYRKPTKIKLQKGWNKFLLKVPQGGNSWKWMYTCVPVKIEKGNIREVEGLRYKTILSEEL